MSGSNCDTLTPDQRSALIVAKHATLHRLRAARDLGYTMPKCGAHNTLQESQLLNWRQAVNEINAMLYPAGIPDKLTVTERLSP